MAEPSTTATVRRRIGRAGRGRAGTTPSLMGIVNATTDSFSDAGELPTLEARVGRADELVADGATVLDVGGESGRTDRPPEDPAQERDAVVPLVAAIRERHPEVVISVDTYKPLVADAALAAGADLVNDVSGLRDPELADVAAAHDAGLILMHTRVQPKEKLLDPARYDDVVADVTSFLTERVAVAVERGVEPEAVVVDPGLDYAKTPAQTIEVLRRIDEVVALGHPVLLAVSRKDFIGALTERGPRERLAGTLATIAHLAPKGDFTYRVHDVREAHDLLTVLEALSGTDEVDPDLVLAEHLRRADP